MDFAVHGFLTVFISIHALREEGDLIRILHLSLQTYFYPRPPRGGRHPAGDRQGCRGRISIHALREEGDSVLSTASSKKILFLSTPSARRATFTVLIPITSGKISIHALREEGDLSRSNDGKDKIISIHALREEGDFDAAPIKHPSKHFYPRPPRGGRRGVAQYNFATKVFLSTPSARRATGCLADLFPAERFLSTPSARRATLSRSNDGKDKIISIHALREEGDICQFYPHRR